MVASALVPRIRRAVVALAFAAASTPAVMAVSAVTPRPLAAQEIAARAYLQPGPTVGFGSTFVLNVEVSGTQRLDADPVLPDLPFAQYLGAGSSTNMQIVNGRTTVSMTVQYRYQALEEGTFEIPSISVRAGGETHLTDPMEVTVTSSPPPTGGAAGRDAAGATGATDIPPDRLFVTAQPSRTTVREGEPLVVEYRIWTDLDVSQYSFTSIPEPEGFWVEDITPEGNPQIEQRSRDGRNYTTAVIRRVALVPTGAGTRTVEPLGVEAQVRVRDRRDPFADFFGSSLFGTSRLPVSVLSNPVELDVVQLPPGRPEPFSGIVGELGLSAALDRDSVAANDAVTLTVTATGSGNIRSIPAPELDLPADFEVFPPEVSISTDASTRGIRGTKTFEYVLIPRAPGSRALPSISMGYFDPASEGYRTAATQPLALRVAAAAGQTSSGITRLGVDQVRRDIRFIKLGDPSLFPVRDSLFGGAAFWIVALLPLVGMVGAAGLRRHRDRMEGDVAYARGRMAGRVARKRLAEARRIAEGDDRRAFYAEVARALRGLVADRLNVAEAGMQTGDVERGVRDAGVSEENVVELMACLEQCDRQRFAPPSDDPDEKARFLDRVGSIMTRLDKELGR